MQKRPLLSGFAVPLAVGERPYAFQLDGAAPAELLANAAAAVRLPLHELVHRRTRFQLEKAGRHGLGVGWGRRNLGFSLSRQALMR